MFGRSEEVAALGSRAIVRLTVDGAVTDFVRQ